MRFVRPVLSALAAVLFVTAGRAPAGEGWETRHYSVPLPWEQSSYRGYHETTRPGEALPSIIRAIPHRYTVTISLLPGALPSEERGVALIMAHLPADARLWFQDRPTTSTGRVRYFESPPLAPGKRYTYTARVVWHEQGKWVSKTVKVPVRAGEMHCLYLTRTDRDAAVAANLAKLNPADRALAVAQQYCPIQSGVRLGEMGVPVKVVLKGQPVFLCCDGCQKKAQADPARALAKVREMTAKNTPVPRR